MCIFEGFTVLANINLFKPNIFATEHLERLVHKLHNVLYNFSFFPLSKFFPLSNYCHVKELPEPYTVDSPLQS